MSTSDLARLSEAAIMLAEARTLPDIRKVHNLADRAKDYAKAARLGIDAQNSAAAIALEAEAKAGELLRRMAEAGERATRRTANPSGVTQPRDTPLGADLPRETREVTPPPATLDDLGITDHESRTWQAVASVAPEVRQEYVTRAAERDAEVTRAGLLRHAGVKPEPKAKKADLPTTDAHRARFPDLAAAELSAEVSRAVAAVRTDLLAPARWADRIGQMRPEDIADVRSKVAHVRRWADEWDGLLAPRPLSVVGGSRP